MAVVDGILFSLIPSLWDSEPAEDANKGPIKFPMKKSARLQLKKKGD